MKPAPNPNLKRLIQVFPSLRDLGPESIVERLKGVEALIDSTRKVHLLFFYQLSPGLYDVLHLRLYLAQYAVELLCKLIIYSV